MEHKKVSIEDRLLGMSRLLDTLTRIGTVLTLIGLIVLAGFNHSAAEARALRLMLHLMQILFGVNIVYDLVFMFRTTLRRNKVIKWIVDIGILSTIIVWIIPDTIRENFPALKILVTGNAFFFLTMAAYSIVEICYTLSKIPSRRTNPALLLASSFLIFIVIGSFLLMLPRCNHNGISYVDSLFIASSAVSITGLSSVDISATFTPLGLVVLSVLIQLGSLGIVTFTSFFAMFFSGTTSIYNQLLLRDVVYSKSMNSLIPTLLYVLGFTLTIELTGALFVYLSVPTGLGLNTSERVIFSLFHSMSSFCNAGFSTVHDGMANPVFMHSGQQIYIITSVLIFAGSVGFPVLVNFKEILRCYMRRVIRKLTRGTDNTIPLHIFDVNTKLVLCTTLSVLAVGTGLFLFLEYDNTLRGMSLYDKVIQSVFNSLIPRSAGFASINPNMFLDLTLLVVIVQMIIGGSSQSMAGGIKVNTLGTVILNLRAVLHGHNRATAFHRTISQDSVRRANAVIVVSAMALVIYTGLIMYLEPELPTKSLVFETVSALFTVGSSLGITGQLSSVSKVVLSTAMFLGRVGILSLASSLMTKRRDVSDNYPVDSIIIN